MIIEEAIIYLIVSIFKAILPYLISYILLKKVVKYGMDYYFTRLKNYEEVFRKTRKD